MRSAFLFLVLALGAALSWFFLSTAPTAASSQGSTVSTREAVTSTTNEAPINLATPTAQGTSANERSLDQASVKVGPAQPEIRWNELELLGRLVSHEGEPLTGYTILVAPTGLKPANAGPIPLAQRCITDEQGHCAFGGLSGPGPWDVYAFPMALAVRDSLERNARVGTVTAKNPGDAERVTFTLKTGAVAILRSPLPGDVKAEDIWIEAVPKVRLRDAMHHLDRSVPPASPTVHRFAQGSASEDEDGYVVAMLPATDPQESLQGYGVRARTLDGLFGLVATRKEVLAHTREIVIDEPLERRGRVAIRLNILDVRNEPIDDADWLLAIEAVDWRLLLEDPSRSSPDLPKSLQTTNQNQSWARTGTSTFELTDLPLGVALEIGDIGSQEDPKLDSNGPGTASGGFEPANIVRATPIHGDADPVEVHIHRVR